MSSPFAQFSGLWGAVCTGYEGATSPWQRKGCVLHLVKYCTGSPVLSTDTCSVQECSVKLFPS